MPSEFRGLLGTRGRLDVAVLVLRGRPEALDVYSDAFGVLIRGKVVKLSGILNI
jgi:hypothetical protein